MSLSPVLVAVLAVAALVAAWRAVRHAPRRRSVFVAMQLLLAAALGGVLALRSTESGHVLVVLTAGAEGAHAPARSVVVALDGAAAAPGVERVPDLATALRRHPGVTTVVVRGHGLAARDRDAVRGLPLRFEAAPAPTGLVDVDAPSRVREGRTWTVHGRARGVVGGTIELLGPGDVVLARTEASDGGRFALGTQPKVAGTLDAALRLRDGNGAELERVPLPLVVEAGTPLRIALVAGAPSPELKYLRRWARDAGHDLRTRIALSPGIAVRDGSGALDAATLGELDLLIVDERGFETLAADDVDAAVRSGLGLLLRATGPIPRDVADAWARYGWHIEGGGNAVPTQLHGMPPTATGPRRFARAELAFTAADAALLLESREHAALARWRAFGLGRVGTWTLLDSYRLVLAGDAPRFGTLWADTVETLARGNGAARPRLATKARVGERATVCGIGADARIETAGREVQPLLPVAAAGGSCAAWWPATSGWHTLVDGDQRMTIAALPADAAATARLHARRSATRALAQAAPAATSDTGARDWRTLATWLLVALFAVSWWVERRA